LIRFQSYRSKLQAAFLALSLAAIAVTEWQATAGATGALRQATYERLTAIRETRSRQIERYFDDVRNHVLALATDESTIAALEAFQKSWERIPPAPPEVAAALRGKYRELGFGEQYFPSDARVQMLQYRIHQASAVRDLVLALSGIGPYGEVHTRFHPTLHRYQAAFGFYDILLIGAPDARVLYTVAKEIDIGARLDMSPYRTTSLARAFQAASALASPETVVIEDFAPYAASYQAPASFLAAPVWRAGVKIGVLAIQISVNELNRVMTGDRKWREEGLGRTGQSYIVGPDHTLRTDFRFEIEDPAAFHHQLRAAGTDPALVDRIERNRTSILTLRLTPEAAAGIHRSERGTELTVDSRGVSVLRSHAPLAVPGLNWMLIAEIEADEALAPVRDLRWRIIGAGLLVAVVFILAARWLSGSVTRPVRVLAASAAKLGEGDFRTRIPVESTDEIGELAEAFNRMVADLERTTVSKEEVDRTLAALINAVFVVSARPGAAPEEVLAAPIRAANPAARQLLRMAGLNGEPFGSFLPEDLGAWKDLLQRLTAEGRLPAVQTALQPCGSAAVPVLFTAVVLPEERGQPGGILCAAQDLTEWKAAQDQLRRMSKVFMESADPIVVCGLDGIITDTNAEAERIYDWRREELVGKPLLALSPRGTQTLWNNLLARCLKGESLRNVEAVQVNRQNQRIPVLVTLSLLGGDNPGIAVIAKNITDRKEAERALRQKQQELENLAARLITAQEEERSRLARDLHDDLTQRLAVVAIEAGRLEKDPGLDENQRGRLQLIKQEMARLSDDIHRLSRSLHPSVLNDLGLAAALEAEARRHFERGGAPVSVTCEGEVDSLPKGVQLAIYRIVQEALRNIQKHSGADEVNIDLRRTRSTVELAIQDNGAGFDRDHADWRPGLGLASMEERARLLGGVFRVQAKAGAGTRIEVVLPFGDWNEEGTHPAGR
jgi:PAS domain S-box-containing protein